ncbi:MAG: GNAT family N-acetyltransferase [Myxococcota bacterium]
MNDPERTWNIVTLTPRHQREAFCCNVEPLDSFIKLSAGQNQARGVGRTFIAAPVEDLTRIDGFYTLATGSVERAHLPKDDAKRLPRHPVPVVVLGRLAVDHRQRGLHLGEKLLIDALRRAVRVSEEVGCYAVYVRAKDEHGIGFYQRYGFKRMEDDPLNLFISIAMVKEAFQPAPPAEVP